MSSSMWRTYSSESLNTITRCERQWARKGYKELKRPSFLLLGKFFLQAVFCVHVRGVKHASVFVLPIVGVSVYSWTGSWCHRMNAHIKNKAKTTHVNKGNTHLELFLIASATLGTPRSQFPVSCGCDTTVTAQCPSLQGHCALWGCLQGC